MCGKFRNIKENYFITIIIFLFLAANLLTFPDAVIGWDSSVYVGMGKYIFSFGKAGLWEPIRPLLWPIVLGFIWKIGLDPVIIGSIIMIFISAGTIILTYLAAKKIFDKSIAIIASIIIASSFIFFTISKELLVELPAVFLLLLGFYLYLRNKIFLSGILFGLAFLTKFPTLLFFIILLGTLFYQYIATKKIYFKNLFYITFGFLLIIAPYFIFNYFMYGNAIFPLISAKHVIDNVIGCTVYNLRPYYYYAPLLFRDNPLHIFSIFGIFFLLFYEKKKISTDKILIILYILAFLAYFSSLKCKNDRYIIQVLPFIAIIAGYGISKFLRNVKKKIIILLAVIVVSVSASALFHYTASQKTQLNHEFLGYLSNKNFEGEVLTTTPLLALYTDKKLGLIYYPLYGPELAEFFMEYSNNKKSKISYIFIRTSDIPCKPNDKECEIKTKEFLEALRKNFRLVYYKKQQDEYFIFSQ